MPVVRNTQPRSQPCGQASLPQAWVSPLHWRSHRPGGGMTRGFCAWPWAHLQWPGHRLQGGEVGLDVTGQAHSFGQMVSSSHWSWELGSGSCFFASASTQKMSLPLQKSSIYFLCLEPYVRDRLIGRREPKQNQRTGPKAQRGSWRSMRRVAAFRRQLLFQRPLPPSPIPGRLTTFSPPIIHPRPHLQNPSGQELLIHTRHSIISLPVNTGE